MEAVSECEYIAIQSQIITIGTLVADLDLNGFLQAISHAETMGPFLDPTLWIRGHRNLETIKRLASRKSSRS